MINQLFKNTASALCYSIIQQSGEPIHSSSVFPHNDVVRFVLQQHNRMPDYLRFPIVCLTILFNFWGFIVRGYPFSRQPHTMRWCQILAWKNAPISICRDLMRFYESLVVLCWKSEQIKELN
ncbi:hypothetical protein [Lyngbya sp. PCC 8106]|uniref:hypothetical protein n=1 Tax=Lyngbya sp. (strain PCC 8106) TaxID=313612 RepID=UPI0000EA9C07|nr:hypothetical protein [Lyngbya sp. PCC 8106]EAW37412.1 hypothetical protein L8106_12970 [Lyngbya sp. PCC 8106]